MCSAAIEVITVHDSYRSTVGSQFTVAVDQLGYGSCGLLTGLLFIDAAVALAAAALFGSTYIIGIL